MQRVLIRKPGGYRRLELVSEPDPTPARGEARVAVEAIGVNYADCIVRMGLYSSAKKYVGWPITPGFDFAGRVDAVGEGVDEWAPGDRVVGVTRFGAYQSSIVVPSHQLFRLPEGWTMERAAAFPTVHLTAWYALCDLGRPRPGQKVLVHTAAGGVGTAALRICKQLGQETIGIVGTQDKVEVARDAGANHVVVRAGRGSRYWDEVRELCPDGFDVVLEASGATTLRKSYEFLRPTGRLMIFGMGTLLPSGGRWMNPFTLAWKYLRMPRFDPLRLLDENKLVAGFNLSYLFEEAPRLEEAMRQLLGWADEGALPPPPLRTYPLADVRRAHADLESARTVGKLVLTVGDS